MAIDLLDTPVRLTWDLHGPGCHPDDRQLLVIADRIVAAGVFFVTLEERPLAHPAFPAIATFLADGGCRLTVVCEGSAGELSALDRSLPPVSLQLDLAAFLDGGKIDLPALREVVDCLRQTGLEPSLRLTPLRSNLPVIPELLRSARVLGIRSFKLPNARIGDSFRGYTDDQLPRWADLESFRCQWEKEALMVDELPELEIHDRFLWEIMTPGQDQARSEYGGCQAGNSLAHIDAGGILYPCAAWPIPLGSLHDATLEELWQTPQRFVLRAAVVDVPGGCDGCRDYPLCFGGCRGLGALRNAAAGGRDPMCRAPR